MKKIAQSIILASACALAALADEEEKQAMSDVTQADRDLHLRLLGIAQENADNRKHGRAIVCPTALLAAHRIAAEKAVLQNGVNCSSCGVRLPKDYEKPCPDCGAVDAALADALETI